MVGRVMPSDTVVPPGTTAEIVSTFSWLFCLAEKLSVSRPGTTGPLIPTSRSRCRYGGLLPANGLRAFRWSFWNVKFTLP